MITILGRLGFTAVILLSLVGLSSAVRRIADTVAVLNNPPARPQAVTPGNASEIAPADESSGETGHKARR